MGYGDKRGSIFGIETKNDFSKMSKSEMAHRYTEVHKRLIEIEGFLDQAHVNEYKELEKELYILENLYYFY